MSKNILLNIICLTLLLFSVSCHKSSISNYSLQKDALGILSTNRLLFSENELVNKTQISNDNTSKTVNYISYEKENSRLKVEKQQMNIILISSVCGIIFLLFIIIFYIYHNYKVQHIQSLKYDKIRFQLEKQEEKFHEFVKTNLTRIEKEKKAKEEFISSDIYKHFLNAANGKDSLKITECQWRQLSDAVNQIYSEFDNNLYSLCKVSLHEYRVCLLLKSEFSTNEIAKLTNHSKQAITSTKSRLYKKAFGNNGGAKDWSVIMNSL
ncbi:MAG: hypothetical protein J6A70_05745 [Prevotella sp.]|nr:hypothetical protein [Prevotella sp.]